MHMTLIKLRGRRFWSIDCKLIIVVLVTDNNRTSCLCETNCKQIYWENGYDDDGGDKEVWVVPLYVAASHATATLCRNAFCLFAEGEVQLLRQQQQEVSDQKTPRRGCKLIRFTTNDR